MAGADWAEAPKLWEIRAHCGGRRKGGGGIDGNGSSNDKNWQLTRGPAQPAARASVSTYIDSIQLCEVNKQPGGPRRRGAWKRKPALGIIVMVIDYNTPDWAEGCTSGRGGGRRRAIKGNKSEDLKEEAQKSTTIWRGESPRIPLI